MSKILRIIFGIIGLIAISLLTAVAGLMLFVHFYDWNNARPHIASLSKKYLNQEIRITGPLSVRAGVHPKITAQDLMVESTPGVATAPLLTADYISIRFDLWPILKNTLLFPEIIVRKADVDLVTTDDGRSNFEFGRATTPAEMQEKSRDRENDDDSLLQAVKLVVSRLSIKDSRLSLNDTVQSVFTSVETGMVNEAHFTWRAHGTFNALAFSTEGTAIASHLLTNFTGPLFTQATARLGDIHFNIDGHLAGEDNAPANRPDQQLTITAKGENLHTFLAALGYRPNGEIAAVNLKTVLEHTPDTWSLRDTTVQVGESKASGLVQFVSGTPGKLIVDAKSERLRFADFGPFFPASESGKLPATEDERTAAGKKGKLYSDEPLAVTAFDTLELAIKADVANFSGPEKAGVIKGFVLDLTGAEGKLALKPLKLRMDEGTITTNLTYDSTNALQSPESVPRKFHIKSDLAAVELGPLAAPYLTDLGLDQKTLGKLHIKDLFAGNISGVLEARSEGRSVAEMMAGLDGSLDLALRDGKMSSVLVEALGLDLTEILGSLTDDRQLVDMSCLLVGMDAENGLITSRVILAATSDSNIYAKGRVDLGKETIDVKVTTLARDFSLGSLSTPLEITGTFTDPKISLERDGAFARLGVAAILGAAVHPAAAVIALIEPGNRAEGNGSCQKYTARLKALPYTDVSH